MATMFDFMPQGQAFSEGLAKQFGLSPDQTRKAMEALMPAFWIAMQQQATRPDNLMRFFSGMTGQSMPFGGMGALGGMGGMGGMGGFSNPFMPSGFGSGFGSGFSTPSSEDFANLLFGGAEIRRAVADQAAQWSGVNATIVQEMIPAIATSMMASFMALMTSGDQGGLMGQFLNFFTQKEETPKAEEPAAAPEQPAERNPADFMNAMMKPWFDAMGAPFPQPKDETPQSASEQGLDAMKEMAATGKALQDDHFKTMQNIFEKMKRR